MFDDFIRKHIDCSKMYEDKFYFNGQEYDGKGIRKVITDIEEHGFYILSYILNHYYKITTNQQWFDKHVKNPLDKSYSNDLSDGTYQYMNIPDIINERITNNDWTHLAEGPLPFQEYLNLFFDMIKELQKIDSCKNFEKLFNDIKTSSNPSNSFNTRESRKSALKYVYNNNSSKPIKAKE